MPLFRSHTASSDATSRRTDLERQIGCITGFFQIFDQQQRKQIGGPRKDAPLANPPHAIENPSLSNYVPVEDHSSTLGNQCPDAKVVRAGDNETLLDSSAGESEMQGLAATQSTNASNGHSALANHSQQEKLHRLKTSQVREELHHVRETMRHRSFNHSRDREEEIAFSPRGGNHGAYAPGGRRFTEKGMNSQGRFSVDASEEHTRGMPITREEERWGFWSSPASHWPSSNGNAGQQGQTHEVAAEGVKSAWLAKGARTAERHWAAENSLEDWKQSLRALARLREDRETGDSSSNGRCTVPKAPSRSLRNEPPASPARASAFDFKEAIRWSQRASSQAESSRRSWDDRDLPRSIAELRDAIHARSRLLSSASPPPTPRPPSVVARLMGLDDLPKPSFSEPPASLVNNRDRKPSGEAKLLQQLLQYSPPSPPPSTQPPSPTLYSLRRGSQGACPTNAADGPTSTVPYYGDPPMRSELQSMLKRFETMSLSGNINTSGPNNMSNNAKLRESPGHAGSWEEIAEPLPFQSPVSKKKNSQQNLPVVVLKQSEEIRSHSPRSSDGFHDEIDRRLRQLGLQSSEQERKTLKQILEAMQLKGLLRPPDSTKSSNGTKRQQASSPGSPRLLGSASPARTPSDGVINSWPSPASKSAGRPSSNTRPAKNDTSAIVIMRPMAKSMNRALTSGDDRRLGNEKAVATASWTEKVTPRKPKSTVNAEANTLKQSGGGRPKSRSSTLALPNTSVQTRKLSLKIRQGQVHLVKGSSRAASPEQAQKSGSEHVATTRRQERALCKASVKPLNANTCEISPSNVPENGSVAEVNHAHRSGPVPDTSKPSDCISDASGASLDADTSHEIDMVQASVGTPPRKPKADSNFGEENVDCFSKEVIEQCSPVSVLDVHLSDEEADESPKFLDVSESIRALTDFQVDISSCGPLLEELRFSPEALKHTVVTQPAPLEMYSKAMVEDSMEACSNLVDLLDASEDILQAALDKREQACASTVDLLYTEDALQDDMDCARASTVDTRYTKNVVGVSVEGITDEACAATKQCSYMDVACGGNGNCMYVDLACGSNGDCMRSDDACGSNEDYSGANNVHRVHIDDVCGGNTRDLHNVCVSNGDNTDEVCTSNADFCYTEDVLRAAGLMGDGGCAADGWLVAGGEMRREVYEELEEQWDAVHAEEEGGHIEAEDRDMGGELYRKSQQASMRRRLVFDCLNQIMEGHLSWLGLPGACGVGGNRHLSVSLVWGDLQRLEQGPCSAEDSMYAMLEQDLLHDADYSTPLCWRGMPTEFATVALHLEQEIFDSLALEIFSQAESLH